MGRRDRPKVGRAQNVGIMYVIFGSWVNGRAFADEHALTHSEWVCASETMALERVQQSRRQIEFVRYRAYTPLPKDTERWMEIAAAGRARNEENGFGAVEVINV